jgi:hypothetical protein
MMAGRSETSGPGSPAQAEPPTPGNGSQQTPVPTDGRLVGPVRYEFLVAGRLSDTVLASFPELRSSRGPAGGTALYGVVEDSAHLHGLLNRFQTLGISIAEMRQLPD